MGRFALKAAGRIFVFAAAAVPAAGAPQAGAEPAPGDRQQAIVEQIQNEQTRNGANSPELISPLTALGLFYLEQSDRALAESAFERARQVVRVNYGLNALEEAPLLRQLARIEEARGNFEAAWAIDRDLLNLAERHVGDLRTVPILREIAAKRLDTLDRYHGGEYPPQIVLGCYYAMRPPRPEPSGFIIGPANQSCTSGSRGNVKRALLWEARTYQAQAIEALLNNGRHASDELREFVTEVIRSSIEQGGAHMATVSRHILSYAYAAATPLPTRTNILIQLADRNVHRAQTANSLRAYESVLEQYEHALTQLTLAGVEQTSIDEIFAPSLPVVLPAFLPNPLDSNATSGSTGYIDVAFDVTKYGTSDNIEILDTTTNASRAARRDLLRVIKRGSFRPRVQNGRIADAARVVVRYRLSE